MTVEEGTGTKLEFFLSSAALFLFFIFIKKYMSVFCFSLLFFLAPSVFLIIFYPLLVIVQPDSLLSFENSADKLLKFFFFFLPPFLCFVFSSER